MKNYILVVVILFLTSCKTTSEEYSSYPFIDQGIQSNKYEVVTLMHIGDKLTNAYGYYIPFGRIMNENTDSEKIKSIMAMPFLLFNKPNIIYFTIESRKMKHNYLIEYKIKERKVDSLKKFAGDNYSIWQNELEKFYKLQNSSFIGIKFTQSESYKNYKVSNVEYHSEISEEEKKKVLEEYKNSSEEIKQDIIKTYSLRYNTIYAELQMPQEKIYFKFNSNLNKNIEFLDNEELYKKGYMYIYIHDNLNMFPHSGGLYLIRPKEKK